MTRRFPKETEWTSILLAAHRLGVSKENAMKLCDEELFVQTRVLDRIIKENDEGRLKALEAHFKKEQRKLDA